MKMTQFMEGIEKKKYLNESSINEARTIGEKRKGKIRDIVRDAVAKNYSDDVEMLKGLIPEPWFEIWEGADSEIERVIVDELFRLQNESIDEMRETYNKEEEIADNFINGNKSVVKAAITKKPGLLARTYNYMKEFSPSEAERLMTWAEKVLDESVIINEKKMSSGLLKWRKKQKKGAIMKPALFNKIVEKNKAKYGEETAKKIAGKIYWKTAEKKFKKANEGIYEGTEDEREYHEYRKEYQCGSCTKAAEFGMGEETLIEGILDLIDLKDMTPEKLQKKIQALANVIPEKERNKVMSLIGSMGGELRDMGDKIKSGEMTKGEAIKKAASMVMRKKGELKKKTDESIEDINESDIREMELLRDIDILKKSLKKKIKIRGGIWENFGQKELKKLEDKWDFHSLIYGNREERLLAEHISKFKEWIETYSGLDEAKNPWAKSRTIDNPYEIWRSYDGNWEWKVLKKWQIDDNKKDARWFCGVKSPFTYGDYELGDVFVSDIKRHAKKIYEDKSVALNEPVLEPKEKEEKKEIETGGIGLESIGKKDVNEDFAPPKANAPKIVFKEEIKNKYDKLNLVESRIQPSKKPSFDEIDDKIIRMPDKTIVVTKGNDWFKLS